MVFRTLRAALAGSVACWWGFLLLFLPAQAILSDPALRSAQFIAVLADLPTASRSFSSPWLVPAGMAVLALIQAVVFARIRKGLPAGSAARGLTFGGVSWALCFPWFEFYLPWNVMRVPPMLVLLDLLLWAGVMMLTGLAISFAYGSDRTGAERAAAAPRKGRGRIGAAQ
jgi:hypothetical protein